MPYDEMSVCHTMKCLRAGKGYAFRLVYIDLSLVLNEASAISSPYARVMGQGLAWRNAANVIKPVGYRSALTFDIMKDGKRITSSPGTVSIQIPSIFRATGRTYALIGVDRSGHGHLYADTDRDPDTVTAAVADNVSSFALIYKD